MMVRALVLDEVVLPGKAMVASSGAFRIRTIPFDPGISKMVGIHISLEVRATSEFGFTARV
jgi:hypothetical protein